MDTNIQTIYFNTEQQQTRDISIDFVKFFAVLLVFNSHLQNLYPEKINAMATGGAIGDALFFFCSGYTLLLGRNAGFFNWYKRRINRIYPTVFAWAIMRCLWLNSNENIITVILNGGGWFVTCIMLYYIVFWAMRQIIGKLEFDQIKAWGATLILTTVSTLTYYICWGTNCWDNCIYGHTKLKWIFFFGCMIIGTICGQRSEQHSTQKTARHILFLLSYIALFYAFAAFKKYPKWESLQLISLIPLGGILYEIWLFSKSKCLNKLYQKKYIEFAVRFLGGLCLEVYLVKSTFLSFPDLPTHFPSSLFPINLFVFFIFTIAIAYILRCLARVFAQTFKEGDYDWKEIVKPF